MFPAKLPPIRSDAEVNVRMADLSPAACIASVECLNRRAGRRDSPWCTRESNNTFFQNAEMGSQLGMEEKKVVEKSGSQGCGHDEGLPQCRENHDESTKEGKPCDSDWQNEKHQDLEVRIDRCVGKEK